MSELVEAALRLYFEFQKRPGRLPRLPRFRGGQLVDIADREALYDAMEGPEFWERYR